MSHTSVKNGNGKMIEWKTLGKIFVTIVIRLSKYKYEASDREQTLGLGLCLSRNNLH